MNAKMEEKSSKEIYKKRKVIVEPVFGQIKNTGFRGFSVRGHGKQVVNSPSCVLYITLKR